ncbi:MAG: hypothetical protein RI580_13100 [Halothece sp. Uz-M2-17]|nr:hypothetical protein [Halothece sp. Uz-M2-17]
MLEIKQLTEDAVTKATERREQVKSISLNKAKQVQGGNIDPLGGDEFPISPIEDITTMGMYPQY